ncbi:MAG: hypothetical protein GX766_09765 [Firmicutes bacterium]|nr:hypothetical protein [Bacillota bacterium]
MGADLTRKDFIVLRHCHHDHCGGLVHFPKTTSLQAVCSKRFWKARR